MAADVTGSGRRESGGSPATAGLGDVLTTGQAARLCNVAPQTVSKWLDTGLLDGYRIPGGKHRRIPIRSLDQFMRQHGLPLAALEAWRGRSNGRNGVGDPQALDLETDLTST